MKNRSYKRYKEDTNVFATWLSYTARENGYEPHIPIILSTDPQAAGTSKGRLKGKDRIKARNQSQQHVLGTRDILDQAKSIAGHKKGGKTNLQHQYFISILEQAFCILEPCFETATVKSSVQVSNDPQPPANQFEVLELEDIDDDMTNITVSDVVPNKTKESEKCTAQDTYEIEVDNDTEMAFMIYCFFEDLHRIQDLLKETWKQYTTGSINLLAASVTTDTAFALVQKTEEDIISQFPKYFLDDTSYGKFASIVLGRDASLAPRGERQREYDEFVYGPVYRIFVKFFMVLRRKPTFPPRIPSAGAIYTWSPESQPTSNNWQERDEHLSQILIELFLRVKCYDVSELVENKRADDTLSRGLQDMIDARNSFRGSPNNPAIGYSNRNIKVWVTFGATILLDIWEILGRKLPSAYTELRYRAAVAKEKLGSDSQKTMIKIWSKNAWNAVIQRRRIECAIERSHLVILKSTWLDLVPENKILYQEPSAAEYVKEVAEDMQQHIDHDETTGLIVGPKHVVRIDENDDTGLASLDGPTNEEETEKEQGNCMEMFLSAAYERGTRYKAALGRWIVPSIQATAKEMESRKLRVQMIRPSLDPAFYNNNNPIYCGLESLNIALQMDIFASQQFNICHAILQVAHLDNAARMLGVLQAHWSGLDRVISLHMQQFFAGEFPDKPRAMKTRFATRQGCSATQFASGRRVNSSCNPSQKKNIAVMKISEVSQALWDRWSDGDQVQRFMVRMKELGPKVPGICHDNQLELLKQIRDTVNEWVPIVDIDTLTLTKQCLVLLERIREALAEQPGFCQETLLSHVPNRFRNDVELNNQILVSEILQRNITDHAVPSPIIQIVGATLTSFYENLTDAAPVEPLPIPTLDIVAKLPELPILLEEFNVSSNEREIWNRNPEYRPDVLALYLRKWSS
ncbi:hypothetical protein JHW43_005649 [Diplocarpon mali]|nr:hypothetical protein JHW43_005649 [Diplocarpon mali]